MRYSDLTPEDLAVLRILAALEQAYPQHAESAGKRRPSTVLAGYTTWRSKGRTPQPPVQQVERDRSRDEQKT